jgi:hypothetical protein
MANGAMFATISPFLVIYVNTSKAIINLQKLTKLEPLTVGDSPEGPLNYRGHPA